MPNTIPNKEIIRRISRLFGASKCYLLSGKEYTEAMILVDIKEENIEKITLELREWCGMDIKVYTFKRKSREKT